MSFFSRYLATITGDGTLTHDLMHLTIGRQPRPWLHQS